MIEPQNLAHMLRITRIKYGRSTAICYGQKKLTYDELDDASDNFCSSLMRLGIEKGQRVAILLFNRPEFIISYFGILKAGATIVPLNTMLKTEEIRYMLEDAGAVAIVTSSSFMDIACDLKAKLKNLKHVILLGSEMSEEAVDFPGMIRDTVSQNRVKDIDAEDLAVIMYTSGTTGHPKGAMLTHKNLLSNARSSAKAIKITHWDCFVCVLPLFHSFAATVCMLLPIYCGAKIIIFVSPRPFKRVMRTMIRKRATIFTGIPSIFNILKDSKLPALLTAPVISRIANPIRLCISGAAALPIETLVEFEKRFKIPLIEGYGLTEASPVVSLNPLKGERKPGSIGLPLPDVEVKAVNDNGEDVPLGEIGELLVKGPNVMKGYLNQPQANAQTIKDNWLYTGDLAKFDSDGYIYIVGRKKEMVNVRGLNVYPKELEDVLYEHPYVKEAAVIGVIDKHKGEVPKGFVTLKDGVQKKADEVEHELLLFLRDRLALYKIPKRIEIIESFPKTSTGKILKRNLQ